MGVVVAVSWFSRARGVEACISGEGTRPMVGRFHRSRMNGKSQVGIEGRREFLLGLLSLFLTVSSRDLKIALKGLKNDKTYQLCLSNCVYKCTVPKGALTKDRQTCLQECKVECTNSAEHS